MPRISYSPRRDLSRAPHRVVHYHAPVYDPSGYAQAARGYVLNLPNFGWQVKLHPASFWSSLSVPLSSEVLSRLKAMESFADLGFSNLHVYHMTPEFYPTHSFGIVKLGYVVTEVSQIHPLWVDRMNRMHTILTASQFCKEVFVKSGVSRPIYVVPHGFDPKVFYPASKPRHGPLNIISVFQWTVRKGWDVLLKAYLQAFSRDDNVRLFLVTYRSSVEPKEFDAIMKDYRSIVGDSPHPEVHFVKPFVPESALAELYRKCHVFVLPSRGEGFCLPALEAMACGCMPVVTDATAFPELVKPQWGRLIKVDKWVPCYGMPWIPWYRPEGSFKPHWVEPNVDHLADIFKWCLDNRDEVIALGEAAAKVAKENYTWSRVTALMSKVLEQALPKVPLRLA